MLFLFFVTEVFDLYGLATGTRFARILSLAFRYTHLVLPFLAFIQWTLEMHVKYKHLDVRNRPFKEWFSDISNEDTFGCFAISISFFSVTGQALLPLVKRGGLFFVEDFTPIYLILYNTMISVYAVILGVIPNRITINNSFKLQSELDHRRVFVRFSFLLP